MIRYVDIVSGKLELCHQELDINIVIVDNPQYHGESTKVDISI